MSKSAYTPRAGSKVELAANALRQGPMTLAQLGEVMTCDPASVTAFFHSAVKNGFVIRVKDEAGLAHYALPTDVGIGERFTRCFEFVPASASEGATVSNNAVPKARNSPAKPKEKTDPQFGCAIWSDGELQLVRDGEEVAVLSTSEVQHLRRYLQLVPVIA